MSARQSERELWAAKGREEGGRMTYLISVKNKPALPCFQCASPLMTEVQQQLQSMLGFNGVTNPKVDIQLINLFSASSACRRILWVWMEPYSLPQPLQKTTN